MKKLNNKGYLLVEIIVASVLAIGIAYFLINLTIKFSSKDKDIYKSIVWTNDKNILTNLIMEDVKNNSLCYIENEENNIFFYFKGENDDCDKFKILEINPTERKITYGEYTKKIDKSLTIGEINVDEHKFEESNRNYAVIEISMTTKYNDENYGLNLFIKTESNSESYESGKEFDEVS